MPGRDRIHNPPFDRLVGQILRSPVRYRPTARRRRLAGQGHDLAELLGLEFTRGSAAVVVRQRFLDLPGQRLQIPLRGPRSPSLLGGLIAGTPTPGQFTRTAHATCDPDRPQALAGRQHHFGTRGDRLRTQAPPDDALQDRPLICRKNDRLCIRVCRDHRFPFSSVIPKVSASHGMKLLPR